LDRKPGSANRLVPLSTEIEANVEFWHFWEVVHHQDGVIIKQNLGLPKTPSDSINIKKWNTQEAYTVVRLATSTKVFARIGILLRKTTQS